MEEPRERAARAFVAALPFARALGLRLGRAGGDGVEIEMPWDARLVGDPATGVLHGGVVRAVAGTGWGAAVVVRPDGRGGTATVGLRVDCVRAARPGEAVTAWAECRHVTRTVAFVRAVARDSGGAFAEAVGRFTVER